MCAEIQFSPQWLVNAQRATYFISMTLHFVPLMRGWGLRLYSVQLLINNLIFPIHRCRRLFFLESHGNVSKTMSHWMTDRVLNDAQALISGWWSCREEPWPPTCHWTKAVSELWMVDRLGVNAAMTTTSISSSPSVQSTHSGEAVPEWFSVWRLTEWRFADWMRIPSQQKGG